MTCVPFDIPMMTRQRRRSGFTLIELLAVIGIILLLLGILIVGLRRAAESARRANTQALMQSIKQGLVVFQSDVGYLPPILDEERTVLAPPLPLTAAESGDASVFEAYQSWHSSTSLAEYLVGYDEARYDGYGDTSTGEVPFTGIRHPGPDGAWSASYGDGTLIARDPVDPEAGGAARVYGPYLELDRDDLLGAVDTTAANPIDPTTGQLRVKLPGEEGYDPTAPKVIVDYWGNPIEYYRRPYPREAINQSYRTLDNNNDGDLNDLDQPSLSWFIKLRPQRFAAGQAQDVSVWNGAMTPFDSSVTAALGGAEFALFSPGTDGLSVWTSRLDPNGWNEDNLVELGP